jgi:serine protease AprX
MSRIRRSLIVVSSVAALAAAPLVTPPASAASTPTAPGSSRLADAPGKGDTDGDHIADDLEAALATRGPGDRVGVIVQGTTPAAAVGAAASFVTGLRYRVIPAFSGTVVAGQVNALARIPGVTRVELDGVSRAFDAAGDRDYGVEAARTAGIATDGSLDGDGVGICVIDTGIDPNHEQLSGRVVGWNDWVNNRTTPYDDHGHGTHVSGIAAGDATGASAAAGEYGGVARGASLIGAKVLNSAGSGSDANVVAAIDWCAQRSDVHVISMSLGMPGGDGSDAASQAANAATTTRGKVVVVAAGNEGDGEGTIASPGVATQVVTVGAASDYSAPAGDPGHDRGLYLAGFSSRGPTANSAAPLKPDVVAPGLRVVAAQAGTTSGYVTYSGTSMATPFVAGVVALGLEAAPGASPASVKAALQASARDAGVAGADNDWGHGLVDARGFVDRLRGFSPAATGPLPGRVVVTGSAPDGGTTDVAIAVTTAGQPLGVSVRIDGELACASWLWVFCLGWEWSPDLEASLLDPSGTVVATSTCPASASNGYCGTVGRFETLGASSAASGTWKLRVQPAALAPNNGKGGSFTADVFGAVDGGTPPPPPPPPAETAPSAPTALTATALSATSVRLAWTDTSTTEDAFEVERCSGRRCTSFGLVTTLGADTATFTDTGLVKATSYTYRVRATNEIGASAWSNTATATTKKR